MAGTAVPSASAHDPLRERDHRRVARFVESVAGIQLPDSKRTLVEARLRKRQRALSYRSLAAYVDFVLDDPRGEAERIHLIDAITTNKTDFYREPAHFEQLRATLAPLWAERTGPGFDHPLHVWSAGCSTGEEPYTLAIELQELSRQHPGAQFEVLATDVSVSCLKAARRGVYRAERIEPVPMPLRRQYLLRGKGRSSGFVRVDAVIRDRVRFRSFNLLADAFEFDAPFDFIFCRNVMIYFGHDDRSALTERFASVLRPGGFLYVGHSETLTGARRCFRQVAPTVHRRLEGIAP